MQAGFSDSTLLIPTKFLSLHMLSSQRLLSRLFLATSLVLIGNTASAFRYSTLPVPVSQPVISNTLSFLQTENRSYDTRIDALNAIKDRGSVPRSQQFVTQWQRGNDTSRSGSTNYVLDRTRQSSWGNYYLYKVASKYVVIAEHTSDPDAPCPTGFTKPCKHFHAGTAPDATNASFSQSSNADAAATSYFKSNDYVQIGAAHHYFYKGN
jgi:hypothetical protein